MKPEDRAKNGEKGVSYGGNSELRGPNRLNAVSLPGIVPDPGLHEPASPYALGIDLDGDDGSGTPPPGIRKHKNYISPDGRKGIDNEYHAVMGCVPGFRGKKGYSNQTPNARRADGNITTIVEISGIDNETNDDSVEVALIHSMDKPIRDTNGSKFSEGLFNFQTEALYYASKRHADGLFNPVTGEYDGISTVYEIDGVPAFMTAAPPKTSNSPKPASDRASR